MHSLRRTGCSLSNVRTCISTGIRPSSKSYSLSFVNFARQHHVAAVVVGGGPAGVAAVGNLLMHIDRGAKVAWVDNAFRGGRINEKYREVPSNTTAGLFLTYAHAVKPLQNICDEAPEPNAVSAIAELPQNEPCSLHQAGDMIKFLSDGLVKNKRVESTLGQVTEARWDETTSTWSLTVNSSTPETTVELTAPLVVYCTGSSPATAKIAPSSPTEPSPAPLDLELALKPSGLAHNLPTDKPLTIGVVGTSHSAVLVLMNLVQLAQSTHPKLRVKWFARTPYLKYAKYLPGGVIKHDNTGLKGSAAKFAKAQLEAGNLKRSDAGRVISRVDCDGGPEKERASLDRYLPQCDYLVQAVGYVRDPLPKMERGLEKRLTFDHETGGFTDRETGKVVKGLFGAGIAFPQRVVDASGSVEFAVGFFKFMKFLKMVTPEWVSEVRK
ncbi:pyridine nucleotide-disulfide oxidoreductase-domain-containing protein [Bombardia bombarda]|uniref:Pyridine nucleotide-disulfide oxidoreductase-domain-containing protein n=1 Tax=Bombardia bombarda TaxID=252184 RepID=A0AA39X7S5_9PEZI|nr:pyridine nucleotide-disulfide oxidoreductase-domain-containing protein [Bombardia bombarda]